MNESKRQHIPSAKSRTRAEGILRSFRWEAWNSSRGRSKIGTLAAQCGRNGLDREQLERDRSEVNLLFGTPRSRRTLRKSCPALEDLEHRTLLSGYSPTAIEELYLEELNDARFNPAAYGVSLGLDLSSVAPSQPLAMNTLLVESARLHSQDMIAQDYFSHYYAPGGWPRTTDRGDRIQRHGLCREHRDRHEPHIRQYGRSPPITRPGTPASASRT